MSRILAIDYGKKRTGLAVTDPLCIIANGLATVPTSELFEFLNQYIAKEAVSQLVIGKPIQPNGQPSENLARVEQFVNRWRKAHPELPIDYYDERFTSVIAHQAMIAGGLRRRLAVKIRDLLTRFRQQLSYKIIWGPRGFNPFEAYVC